MPLSFHYDFHDTYGVTCLRMLVTHTNIMCLFLGLFSFQFVNNAPTRRFDYLIHE